MLFEGGAKHTGELLKAGAFCTPLEVADAFATREVV